MGQDSQQKKEHGIILGEYAANMCNEIADLFFAAVHNIDSDVYNQVQKQASGAETGMGTAHRLCMVASLKLGPLWL